MLAYQFDFPVMAPGNGMVSPEVVTAYEAPDKVGEDLRELRNQVLLTWKSREEQAQQCPRHPEPGAR